MEILFIILIGALAIASVIVGIRDGEDYAQKACPKSGRRCIGVRCAHFRDCEVSK